MIRANDILPGPVPIWDKGVLLRPLTLEESKALIEEFRTVREDYGRVVVKFREMEQRTAAEELRLRSVLRALVTAKGREQVKHATRRAMEILSKIVPGEEE